MPPPFSRPPGFTCKTKEGVCWGSLTFIVLTLHELVPAAKHQRNGVSVKVNLAARCTTGVPGSERLPAFPSVRPRYTRLQSAEIYRPQPRSRRAREILAGGVADVCRAERSTALPQMKIRYLRGH